MVSVKSPINRIGGKHFLTGWLSRYIPGHTLYCEVFAGAGHLLFAKTPSPAEVINDIDGYLISFFQVVKDSEKRERLIQELGYTPYSRMIWQAMRDNWKQGALPQDEITRVAQWYYLNRTCFAGDSETGGFAVPSVTGRNPVQSFRNSIDSFDAIAGRLRNVCIENLDYAECLKRYDSSGTLFYIDCPYYGSKDYYGNSFTEQDHHGLSELLQGIKGKAMVSHYANGLYDRLYQGWNRYEFESFKGSHKAGQGAEKPKTLEVIYCNFEPSKKYQKNVPYVPNVPLQMSLFQVC